MKSTSVNRRRGGGTLRGKESDAVDPSELVAVNTVRVDGVAVHVDNIAGVNLAGELYGLTVAGLATPWVPLTPGRRPGDLRAKGAPAGDIRTALVADA